MQYEQSIERIEEIIYEIENGETDLESVISLYKEGLTLAKACGERLDKYEAEISVLKKEFDGTFSLKAFNEGSVDDEDDGQD